MSKILLTFLVLFIVFPFYGQDDDATADIVAAIGLASVNEAAALKLMAEKQEEVYASVKDIAFKTAVMVVLKQKYLNSLKKVNPLLEKSLFFKQLVEIGQDIIMYQEKSLELAKNHPEIYEKATVNHIRMALDTYLIMEDLKLATLESDENQIDDIDRLDIMDMVKDDLLKIKGLSYQLYTNIKVLVLTDNLEPSEIDFTDLLNDIVDDYERIFPETLKDEN